MVKIVFGVAKETQWKDLQGSRNGDDDMACGICRIRDSKYIIEDVQVCDECYEKLDTDAEGNNGNIIAVGRISGTYTN